MSDFGNELLEKAKDFFTKRRKVPENKPEGFTGLMAIERFKLVDAAGPEGQNPKVTYSEGNTVILNSFSPGTILREYIEGSYKTGEDYNTYIWWCVGGSDSTGSVTLFDAYTRQEHTSYTLKNTAGMHVVERKILPTANQLVEFPIGQLGSLVDVYLCQNNNAEYYLNLRSQRKTLKIDVIDFGKSIKKRAEKTVPDTGLKRLVGETQKR